MKGQCPAGAVGEAGEQQVHDLLQCLTTYEEISSLASNRAYGAIIERHFRVCSQCSKRQDELLDAELAAMPLKRRAIIEKAARLLAEHLLLLVDKGRQN